MADGSRTIAAGREDLVKGAAQVVQHGRIPSRTCQSTQSLGSPLAPPSPGQEGPVNQCHGPFALIRAAGASAYPTRPVGQLLRAYSAAPPAFLLR